MSLDRPVTAAESREAEFAVADNLDNAIITITKLALVGSFLGRCFRHSFERNKMKVKLAYFSLLGGDWSLTIKSKSPLQRQVRLVEVFELGAEEGAKLPASLAYTAQTLFA